MKMIKVGFIIDVSDKWIGGKNYYKNLLYAIKELKQNEIEIYVFSGTKMDEDSKDFRLHQRDIYQ